MLDVRDLRGRMSENSWMQCLLDKADNWSPEPGDEQFAIDADNAWLTGISTGPPDEFEIEILMPALHGVSSTLIMEGWDASSEWGTPMHPACFSIFKRLSIDAFGYVDIDGLRHLWYEQGDFNRFKDWLDAADVRLVKEQYHDAVPGTEYLVAHPLRIPGLQEIFQSCIPGLGGRMDVIFGDDGSYDGNRENVNTTTTISSRDPFVVLPPELKFIIVSLLPRKDVANLRLACRSFRPLPQSLFRDLVHAEMPWVLWDIPSVLPGQMDWYELWRRLAAADGGSKADETARWLTSGWVRRESTEPNWRRVMDALSPVQLRQFEDRTGLPLRQWYQESEENEERTKEIAMAIRTAASGITPDATELMAKATEVKGLRNRRRIFGEVQEIIRRIIALREVEEEQRLEEARVHQLVDY